MINRKIFGNALTKIVFLEKNRKKRKTPLSKRSFRFFSEKIIFVSLRDHFVTSQRLAFLGNKRARV